MLSRCFLDISVSVWAFVIGLSEISSFLSYLYTHGHVGHMPYPMSIVYRELIFYL